MVSIRAAFLEATSKNIDEKALLSTRPGVRRGGEEPRGWGETSGVLRGTKQEVS